MSQISAVGWEAGARVPVIDDDFSGEIERPERSALVTVRRIVGMMLADTHPALGIECMALVTGIGYEGSSMAGIADRHGVTRATVSARCVELADSFGLSPSRAMRSVRNRQVCAVSRLRSVATD